MRPRIAKFRSIIVIKIKMDFKLFLSDWKKLDMFKMQEHRNYKGWKMQNIIRKSQIPDQLCIALASFSLGRMPEYYNYINQSTIPIHIINGIDDIKYIQHTKSLYTLNRQIYHHIIDKSYHNVHLENPMNYIRILKKPSKVTCKKDFKYNFSFNSSFPF